jgi:hypothetical protein
MQGSFQVPNGKFLVELRTEKLPVRKTLIALGMNCIVDFLHIPHLFIFPILFFRISENDTADEFLARYFDKYLAKMCPGKTSKDFVMKVLKFSLSLSLSLSIH